MRGMGPKPPKIEFLAEKSWSSKKKKKKKIWLIKVGFSSNGKIGKSFSSVNFYFFSTYFFLSDIYSRWETRRINFWDNSVKVDWSMVKMSFFTVWIWPIGRNLVHQKSDPLHLKIGPQKKIVFFILAEKSFLTTFKS